MPTTLNLTLEDLGFPSNFSGDVEDFKDAIIDNVGAVIDTDQIILGQVDGTMPTTDIGPWLDGNTWKTYDGAGGYKPAVIRVGTNTTNYIQINPPAGGVAANRNIYLQGDRDGTLALTSDIYDGRATTVLSGTTVDIDWSTSNNFYQLLSGDTTYTMTNSLPGQEISVIISNSSADNIPTFDGTSWNSGVAPDATHLHTVWSSGTVIDLYIFKNVAGTIYGRALLDMK